MVLGKLPVPGRNYNLDYSRTRAYCTCSRCGWGCLDIFTLIYSFSPLAPSLWETARYRLKYYFNRCMNNLVGASLINFSSSSRQWYMCL